MITKKGKVLGGKRNGSGRKPGTKNPATLEKEKVQAAVSQQIMLQADNLIRAAMIPAMGLTFVYRIDEEKTSKGTILGKKHVLVRNPDEIKTALDQMEAGQGGEDKYYYIVTERPDFRAVQMLLDRSLGKAKESVEITNPDGNLKTIIINKAVKK